MAADHSFSRWRHYVSHFHNENAGITSEVLGPAKDDQGQNPYQWLASALLPRDQVLYLGGGNGGAYGPEPAFLTAADRSLAEVQAAIDCLPNGVVADATALPYADEAFDVVAMSMSLMLVQPLTEALAEATRVLRPGGRLIATVPASGPLSTTDALRYGQLLLKLRITRLKYPNDTALAEPAPVVAKHHLEVISDQSRRFALPLTEQGGRRLVESLYLPDVTDERRTGAGDHAERWRGEIGIPIRRIVATRKTA